MGQYQQWLQYQELDRHLRAELEVLAAELAQLQDAVHLLERSTPQADNVIIRALATCLNGQLQSLSNSTSSTTEEASSSLPNRVPAKPSELSESEKPGRETISPALLDWGGLPDFGPQKIEEPFPGLNNAVPSTPPTPHPELALLPEDMIAFFDEYSQTEPQLELPWWLHNIAIAALTNANNAQGTAVQPIDPESMRTNRLVQRWIERWGRQLPPNSSSRFASPSQLQSEEGE